MINLRLPITRLAIAPLLILAANAAYAATTVVYPTGVYPTDLNNVQNAVNAGGNVLLKATDITGQPQSFNFAIWDANTAIPPNSDVNLTANVAITGETVGANKTTILGGCVPFYEANYSIKASINGIKFVNPQGAAIAIFKSAGITITNNEIDNVLQYVDEDNLIESSGMYISGVNNTKITGPVVVSGNYIHGLDGTYEFGIGLFDVATSMTITGNTIDIGYATDSGNGSTESEGIAVLNANGAAVISGNNVVIGPGVAKYGIAAHGSQTGAVTFTGNQVSVAAGATCYEALGINGATGKVQIIGNLLNVDNFGANAIELNGNQYIGDITGATVSANVISLQNSYSSAIELNGNVTNSSISLNLISGISSYGVSAFGDGNSSDLIRANSFLSNMFLSYSSYDDTFYFDTNTVNNTVRGPYTSVSNNGTGNIFSHSLF